MGSYGAPWDERMMAEWLSHDPHAAQREMNRITMEEAQGKAPWQRSLAAQKKKQAGRNSRQKKSVAPHRLNHADLAKIVRQQQKEIQLLTQALLAILKKQPELVLQNASVRKLIFARYGSSTKKLKRKK